MSSELTCRPLHPRLLSCLVFLAFLSSTSTLSLDFAEHRNKAAKIKIHPRGNLWATGHFMGKKSVEPLAFSSPDTTSRTTLEEMKDRLNHELVRILRLKKSLGMNEEGPAIKSRETSHSAPLGSVKMRILGSMDAGSAAGEVVRPPVTTDHEAVWS